MRANRSTEKQQRCYDHGPDHHRVYTLLSGLPTGSRGQVAGLPEVIHNERLAMSTFVMIPSSVQTFQRTPQKPAESSAHPTASRVSPPALPFSGSNRWRTSSSEMSATLPYAAATAASRAASASASHLRQGVWKGSSSVTGSRNPQRQTGPGPRATVVRTLALPPLARDRDGSGGVPAPGGGRRRDQTSAPRRSHASNRTGSGRASWGSTTARRRRGIWHDRQPAEAPDTSARAAGSVRGGLGVCAER